MELDIKLKQYELNTQVNKQICTEDNSNEENTKSPQKESSTYEDLLKFFEDQNFCYSKFFEKTSCVSGKLSMTMKNGATLNIGKTNGLICVEIVYPDKSKFIGTWTTFMNINEFSRAFDSI